MSFDPQTHYQNEGVAHSYDRERFSSLAGRIFQSAELKTLAKLVRHLPAHASLLDVPCGTGRITEVLLGWGFRVTAADISQEMIEVARSRVAAVDAKLPVSRGSAAALPFAADSFDAVLSIRFLPHIAGEQRRIMLKEMARVSRKWVFFSNSFSSGWYRGRRSLKRRLGHQAPTRYPVTESEIREDLRYAGLEETARFWTFRFVSEELLLLCKKKSASESRG
jgi:ubiquinone/menaquinone biosynthesis C-methylase UbiE